MLNEGKGISNVIKSEIDSIWNLFLQKSYSNHKLSIGNDKIGFKEYELIFVERNNYYSNLMLDKNRNCIITIGIPKNGKEVKVKEVITHELTHFIEIIGLNKKTYPKYWNIKKSLLKIEPKTKVIELLCHCIYKTLDNEVNANIAQTYVYIDSFGFISKPNYLIKLQEYSEWIEYSNILKLNKCMIKSNISEIELKYLNDILIKNDVKTITIFNVDNWIDFWFKIFKKKSKLYLKNAQRIIDEVMNKYKKWEGYSTIPNDSSKNIDYQPFISTSFNDFKNKK